MKKPDRIAEFFVHHRGRDNWNTLLTLKLLTLREAAIALSQLQE